ncbi:GNAT family N-acetyltransferase [Bordetella trematum]|uniref:GNAT family N-acetyltransferase n=1 Tax=Bordetella trematum TaxID=123899 RepID=UPI000D8977B7|nr:GNAT family N-acetyltransferase [Bordetella trematum]SPU49479.1 N-acetyltransferase [Bordetella trematum]VDH08347.1 N-acyltransferase YncA [Bordetella trematum]
MTASSTAGVRLIDCTEAGHSAEILAILNDAILHSTAIYDYAPRPAEAMIDWFAAKRAGGHPVVGVVDAQGRLLGFATWGAFRAHAAYQYTVEHSIYVHPEERGRGLGGLLLRALIARARQAQRHVMIGCIDTANQRSIALHEQAGFTHAGTVRQVGFKFGRWLDAAFYQLVLDTPRDPRQA